jgi:hypothetical protein
LGKQLEIGVLAPNANLKDMQDQVVSLDSLWRNGPTMVTFLRHFG